MLEICGDMAPGYGYERKWREKTEYLRFLRGISSPYML